MTTTPDPDAAPLFGTCDYCAHLKRLRADGTVATHYVVLSVSRRAVPTVGSGSVKRVCSGSGKPPRPPR